LAGSALAASPPLRVDVRRTRRPSRGNVLVKDREYVYTYPIVPLVSSVARSLTGRIHAEIRDRILSGAWAPGRRIPSELELAETYGCSRMTVNKALSTLADEGLVERRRRAGSFVARPRMHAVVLDIPDIQAEIANRGDAYGYELLSARVRPARAPEERALAPEGDLLVLRCRHLAGGLPFAMEHRLINLSAVPAAARTSFAATSPGAWLLAHVAWTQAEHRISAANATRTVARRLDVETGAACLVLERRTWRGDERITYVRQIFPGHAYDLVARFAPARA